MTAIRFGHEGHSNKQREAIAAGEPIAQRTFTPTQAVIAASAGIYHWTAEGRRLYDYTSGVLVANLGHNPISWKDRFDALMGWTEAESILKYAQYRSPKGFQAAVPLTAYNAITPIEAEATARLITFCQRRPGGSRLERVLWAASGAEAIQKSLWAAMARDKSRQMILATRYGYHGKKGLSCAITGTEADPERDPRVRFIDFPREACSDVSQRHAPFNFAPHRQELDALWAEHGSKLGTLITEPYLGGGGSYHPPKAYLQGLQQFCREKDIVFILDEVQANFGRTGNMFAYETYGLSPDIVVLGKGLGNGIPVAAAVGSKRIFDSLGYGEASDTWSANPLSCAAVLATLEAYAAEDLMTPMHDVSAIIESHLVALKQFPYVTHIRGEEGGMVWGVEFATPELARAFVKEAYLGDGSNMGDGVHLLGPLAGKVVRISPPLIITRDEADRGAKILAEACRKIG
ncbi:aspartate aminotransferase family protein [soil metagenome]